MQIEGLCAYKGNQPYIFVSYSHADTEIVFPLLKALQDVGYRIWFDRGIEAGTEWSNNIAEHLNGCSAFLFFASRNSVKSENCLDEIAYAKSNNKSVLLAYLEDDVILPSGMEMQTARFQRVFINRQESLPGFVDSFSAAAMFDICRDELAQTVKIAPTSINKRSINKKIVLASAGVLLAIVVVVALLFLKKPSEIPEELPENIPIEEKIEVIELSDDLKDCTFRLNEVVYKLPVEYSKLKENGWVISTSISSDSYIGGHSKEYITLVNDGKKIETVFYNDSEDAKMLKDCFVGEICVYRMANIDFSIASGLTLDATADNLFEAFGTSDIIDEYTDYTVYKWSFSDYSNTTFRSYNDETNDYSAVEIKNYIYSSDDVATSEKKPKYLNYYVSPTELGSDMLSGSISMDGKIYALPAPLEEFLNDGWKISSGASSIISGATNDYKLTKGDTAIWVNVKNYSKKKIIPKYCLVKRVMVEQKDGPDVVLPGNIVFGLSLEELEALIPEDAEIALSTYSTRYYFSDYDKRNFHLNISVDTETNQLSEISVTNEIYDQLLD